MPRIPTYQPGRVVNSPIPGPSVTPQASAASFGAGDAQGLGSIGEGLQRAGQVTVSIASSEAEQLNTAAVREALTKSDTESRAYLANDVYTKKGNNGINLMPDVETKFKEIGATNSENLTSAQKSMFQQHFSQNNASHYARVIDHQARNKEEFIHNSKLGENGNAIESAAFDNRNPKALEHSDFTITANTAEIYKGMGAEFQKLKVAEARNHLYSTVLESIQAQSASEAAQFLEAHKDKFAPAAFRVYQDRLQNIILDQSINRMSNELASTPGMTREEAGKVVDSNPAIKTLEQRRQVMSGYDARVEEKKTTQELAYRKIHESAWQDGIKNPSRPAPDSFTAEDKIKYNDFQVKMARKARGEEQESHYGEILKVLVDDPSAFSKMNLYEKKANLSDDQFAFFEKAQGKLRSGDDKETKAFSSAIKDITADAADLSIFKINAGDNDTVRNAKNERMHQFRSVASDRIRQAEKEGVPLDYKAVKSIKDDMMKQVVLQGTGWFGTNFRATKARAFEVGEAAADPSSTVMPQAAVAPSAKPDAVESPIAQPGESPVVKARPATPTAGEELKRELGITAPAVKEAINPRGDLGAGTAKRAGGGVKDVVVGAAKLAGKAYNATYGRVGAAIGDELSRTNPAAVEIAQAEETYLELRKAGIETTEIDQIYKKMNGVSIDTSKDVTVNRGFPRDFIKAVDELYSKNAGENARKIAGIRGANRPAVITSEEQFNALPIGKNFLLNGKYGRKDR